MNDRPGIEFLILCGFLGSGKTTLLGQFLASRELRDTAVIVNEAGEVGIDAAVLQAQAPDDPVMMLDNGCVCCSLRSSLVETVLRLMDAPRPPGAPPLARIVLETSGISRPGAVLATLRDRDLVQMNLDFRVVCTFDASRADDAPEHRLDEALAQWAAAHRIVVTKSDLVDDAGLACAEARVAAINPLAERVVERVLERRVERAFGPRVSDVAPIQPPSVNAVADPEAHPRIRVFRGHSPGPLEWDRFAAWVDDLTGLLGDRLLRFKAILTPEGENAPILLQSVGSVFSAPQRAASMRLPDQENSSIIVIARDCEADWIDEQLSDAPVRLRAWRSSREQAFRLPESLFNNHPEEKAP